MLCSERIEFSKLRIMNKTLSLLKNVSLVGFIGVLLYVYAGLPEKVAIGFNEAEGLSDFISRDLFFYGSLSFVILANVAIMIFRRLSLKTNYNEKTRTFLDKVMNWLTIFNLCINLIFSISVSVLARINSLGTIQGVNFELYLILGLFLIPFLAIFYIIFGKK